MTLEQVLEIYKRHGALLKGHFLLSSGLHSDTYLQSALVMQYPIIAEQIISELVKKLYDVNFTTVVSPAIGGIRFGYELARLLKKRSIFTERVDGKMTLRRGFYLDENDLVLIAEDVVTTGKSTKECIDAVLATGAKVIGITSLIDRSGGQAKFDFPFYPLIRLDVKTYTPEECPLCKENIELVKPGSRFIKQ
ncbi:orotate phosphoribosyltransferase [Deferribacteraceae bacterium V6Fe1]|jgi:orotate phosphoribosyltransferase|uniref:orotate phosphoribosyltransferase n=1 Tax=Deferrivibrio essentukiensis TaxID=2880922 RepID=UPI0019AE2E20|nr:orotate phosphoribosyltransferase [Deferrivibrio essentukiensis]MBC7196618.1 orotate phosphoribosyltransferase [Deferribacterales bacterium]MBZ4672680.1 orotate phosphoribosyltransferase [Deferribacteraceae bacterium]MCB4204434.1 orotate phosphoribosyltransferase [Deferrivibrio essentukiensis]UOD34596.1 orotate phosphoribosyltransferase [Deferribacteraceae bacterium V6Fe1]